MTDYDKLTLEIYTNGTLDPDEAVSLAAKVLSEHLNLFIDLSENAKTAEVMVEKENNEKEKVLEMNIDELELSVVPITVSREQVSTQLKNSAAVPPRT